MNSRMETTIDSDMPLATDYLSVRPAVSVFPAQSLSQEEIDDIKYMREEEKLAHDVYITLYEKWGLPIFSNIAQSELTHTEAVYDLISKYGLEDPVSSEDIGVFTNKNLAALYTDLVTKGSKSLTDALIVGATIEDLDIADLATAIETTDNEDVQFVYENLMRGSRNHLRSFISQLQRQGTIYEPEYITENEFEAIIASDRETGSGFSGNGSGTGRSQGGGMRR